MYGNVYVGVTTVVVLVVFVVVFVVVAFDVVFVVVFAVVFVVVLLVEELVVVFVEFVLLVVSSSNINTRLKILYCLPISLSYYNIFLIQSVDLLPT